MNTEYFSKCLSNHIDCFKKLHDTMDIINFIGVYCSQIIMNRHLFIAGNGGSAADAQHFAAELVGRFQANRRALACIALSTDTSNLTAIGNDFGFSAVFARQIEALGQPGDSFIGISTSGNSENIIAAVRQAKQQGMTTIGLLGRDGGALVSLVDHAVVIPDATTARIQEAHIFVLHYWADLIERSIL